MIKNHLDAVLLPTALIETCLSGPSRPIALAALHPAHAWAGGPLLQALPARLDAILERGEGSGPNIDVWGVEPGNRIYLYRNRKHVQSVLIRFDLSVVDMIFAIDACNLAEQLSCCFVFVDAGRAIEPSVDLLVAALHLHRTVPVGLDAVDSARRVRAAAGEHRHVQLAVPMACREPV